jgi:DnaJ-class molecular chaperone with C-terminal Zn finger domain
VENYYDILGIPHSADLTTIKAAYKRLAKEFHPDRNPGNPDAEETFKRINEAYRTLSDPVRKLNYDAKITLIPLYAAAAAYEREATRRQRYQQWRKKQTGYYYKLDKEYFKNQALAFLVFIVISGFFFGLVHAAEYFMKQKHLAQWRANSRSLKEVNSLFGAGQYEQAFRMIESLKKGDPREFRFIYVNDSLVNELRSMADKEFNEKDFELAITHYLTLQEFEKPVRFETLRKLSLCQYYVGNYKESLQALKHLHNQRPWDLELVYQIAIIALDQMDDPQEALQYFTLGKKLFKQNLTQVYGAAFELIVHPPDVPDIYYNLFEGRARSNMLLKNYEEAVTDCNWAIFLRPYKGRAFAIRAQANAELKQNHKICKDLYEAQMRGETGNSELKRKFCR